MAGNDDILFVHYAGWTTAFVQANVESASKFGGTIDHSLSGAPLGPSRLHQIGFVAFSDLEPSVSKPFAGLPLIYGLTFDGCDMSYRVAEGTIDIEFITPDRSADDWPYERYPSQLPAVPLVKARSCSESWGEFRDRLIPNLNELATSKITVVVPPPKALGFSLWGPEGDGEGVSIVFQYDLEGDSVRAFNLCG